MPCSICAPGIFLACIVGRAVEVPFEQCGQNDLPHEAENHDRHGQQHQHADGRVRGDVADTVGKLRRDRSPIGSGQGVLNPWNIRIILEQLTGDDPDYPVIVDAGVGTASDVAIAMELGADGVLLNTGIAGAKDPIAMARAMKLAVEAGYLAASAGRIPRKLYATASSPLEGVIGADQ